jgi:hypothetical protein
LLSRVPYSNLPMLVGLAVYVCLHTGTLRAEDTEWVGRGAYRVLVTVEPVELGSRASDEMPASFELDLDALDGERFRDRAIDFDSVQVIRLAESTGRAEAYSNHAFATSEFDRPFQFYDAVYPREFPDYERYLSHQKDAPFLRPKLVPYGARSFNAVGNGRKGLLVWPHTQQGAATVTYAIYFDSLPKGAEPISPPAGFVGDGSNRAFRESPRFGPPGNVAGRTVDWNGDGRIDLLFGSSDGHLSVYLNGGTGTSPLYRTKKVLLDAGGTPIDVGFSSCPFPVDWNGDGRRDLLVGAAKGCVVWYENRGSDARPEFRFAGFLESDGQMILTPAKPIAEGRGEEVFTEDYFPVPAAVDWDGDRDLDLLLGGYVTGLTFLYENVGAVGEVPTLKPRGPLVDAAGTVIDTGWQAAPAPADLDGDGDLDLMLGGKPISLGGGDTSDPTRALFYYENTGTRSKPTFERREFPADGPPPFGGMGVPSFADITGDGLADLVVIDVRQKVYFFPNTGKRDAPKFDLTVPALQGTWQSEALMANRFADVDGDGDLDVLNGFNVMFNDGRPSPGFFTKRLYYGAGRIKHPHPYGDENPGLILDDLNGDGMLDGIYGAHSGHIWFHENRGTNVKPDLDTEGRQLKLVTGAALKVGLPEGAKIEKFDFNVLQGARARPVVADFNQDGLADLVVGDTYGKVRYYENRGTKTEPVFAEPTIVDDRRSRLFLTSLDWNGDRVPDLVVIKSGIHVLVNKGTKGRTEFEKPETIVLPATQGYLLTLAAVDWNHDGDDDLVYQSAAGDFCFAERSFLKHGYREAKRKAFAVKSK